MPPRPELSHNLEFMTGGGECGSLLRAFDWASTSLRQPELWPAPLKTLVGVMLSSNQPMLIVWGPDRTTLYNDGYAAMCGDRHPDALGRAFEDLWFDIWDQVDPILARAYAGEATQMDDIQFVMHRHGYPEETHFAFSYTPVRTEDGAVAGMFCVCAETTRAVLADRNRLRAEQGFRDSAEELQAVLDALPAAVWIARDPEARDIIGNRSSDELLRIPAGHNASLSAEENVRPAGFRVFQGGRELEPHELPVQAAARGERIERFEEEIRFDDGTTIALFGNAAPLKDGEGRVRGSVAAFVDVTELKQAEAALRESESRFREQFENANDYIFTTDLEMWITSANPAVAAVLGQHPESLIGRNIAEFVPPHGAARNRAMLQAKLSGQEDTTRYDVEVVGPGGVPMIWEINSRLTRGRDGVPNGLHAIGRDITAMRRAESELRESEARFRNMADNAPVMMWVTDETGHCTYLNARWYEFTGQTPKEAEGFGWLDATHPHDKAAAEAEFVSANRRRAEFRIEYRLRRPDGSYRWAIDAASPRFGSAGEFLGYVGSVIDIDERKEAEQALIASEGKFRALAQAMPHHVWTSTPDGQLDWFNERVYAYSGAAPDALHGAKWASLVHPEDIAMAASNWAAALKSGERYETEFRLRDADGLFRWHLARAVAVRDPSGAIVRWIGTNTDIEDQKAAADALRDLAGTLEARVQERTGELLRTQEALRQSQKLEAMGQLTGGVAHDFNNLLSPILGSLDLLQRRGLGGEREQRLIDGALQSAERAKTLVQRLLAFARRQPLQPSAVDVEQLVGGMADLVASTSGPQVKVKVDIAQDIPAARADPNQLEMAILNLSVNARDAMPDGGTLSISALCEDVGPGHRSKLRPDAYIRLSVADTGIGMDAATLARAIEPFFSTKGIGKGTGLGLSMVHGLASQLGGALLVSSKPGLGTNVELWLPVSAGTQDSAERPAQEASDGTGTGTALLVDDEELVRMSTADMLADLGYDVVEASSGEEALKLFEGARRIDLMVTDHLMPGMTGADLARAVRRKQPELPILIVSGYAEAEGIPSDFPRLTKPFRQSDLSASVAQLTQAPVPEI